MSCRQKKRARKGITAFRRKKDKCKKNRKKKRGQNEDWRENVTATPIIQKEGERSA